MPKRVLIVNKFFYNRGGDCIVAMNEERMLRKHGHDTAVFTMDYPENTLPDTTYGLASRREFSGGIKDKLRALSRILGQDDVRKDFAAILKKFQPEIVHFHNIHSYLSPRLVEMAHGFGARTLWTMHDYKLICPAYSMLRNGKICELCLTSPNSVLSERCHKGSLPASTLARIEALKWNRKRLEDATDLFICPSDFMRRKLMQGGFSSYKLATLSNCLDDKKLDLYKKSDVNGARGGIVYAGRLSTEKGVENLVKAFLELPHRLDIYGSGPLEEKLRKMAADTPTIVFHGRREPEEIATAMLKASASILTSECYENNPLGIIESLCAGTPVIGSDLGGIPELIDPESGIIFPHGNIDAMREAVDSAVANKWNHSKIAEKARDRFSEDTFYRKLLTLMEINNED